MAKSLFVMFLKPGDNQEMIRNNPGKQETNSEKYEKNDIRRPHVLWPGGSLQQQMRSVGAETLPKYSLHKYKK